MWKQKILKIFKSTIYHEKRTDPSGYKYSPGTKDQKMMEVRKPHPVFVTMRKLFYGLDENSKRGVYHKCKLPYTMLGNLNLLGLLIWYLDDGNRASQHYGTISVQSFDNRSLARVVNRLNVEYDLDLGLPGKGRNITIKKKSMLKLLPIWNEMFDEYGIPECMRYKVKDLTL